MNQHRPSSSSADDLPSFSVIVPTYNRPRALRTCLTAMSRLDYPRHQIEFIVVDDGSETNVGDVVDKFRDRLDLKLLRQPNSGPATARNTGASAARNDLLALTDDDCAPQPTWLRRLAEALVRHPDALVGGRCRNALKSNPYAITSQTIIDVVHAHFNCDINRAVFFPADNMAVSRRGFVAIGGFDTSFRWSEDRDLCDRWSARGRPLVVAPDALVDHAHVMGLGGFFRQHFGYGRGAWRFHHARKRRGTGRLHVEGNFYLKCFRQPFRDHAPRHALPLGALMGIWQIANTAGFFYEALRHRARPPQAAPVALRPLRGEAADASG